MAVITQAEYDHWNLVTSSLHALGFSSFQNKQSLIDFIHHGSTEVLHGINSRVIEENDRVLQFVFHVPDRTTEANITFHVFILAIGHTTWGANSGTIQNFLAKKRKNVWELAAPFYIGSCDRQSAYYEAHPETHRATRQQLASFNGLEVVKIQRQRLITAHLEAVANLEKRLVAADEGMKVLKAEKTALEEKMKEMENGNEMLRKERDEFKEALRHAVCIDTKGEDTFVLVGEEDDS